MAEKTSTGLEENVAGLLAYLLGFITGIVFYVIEKENKFVRFHAMQSIITFGALFIISIVIIPIIAIVPIIGWIIGGLLSVLIWIITIVLWIILMYKAYKGEKFKLPIVGNIAEKYA